MIAEPRASAHRAGAETVGPRTALPYPDPERPRSWPELVSFLSRAGEAFIGRSHQWVAGEERADAIRAARQSNGRGMEAILNHLGERFLDRSQVEAAGREYLDLLDAMRSEGIRGAISVKPTQFGLLLDKGYALSQLVPVAEAARAHGRVLWLDMERVDTTDDTLWLGERLLDVCPEVGICLQANLKRTAADIDRAIRAGARIRLVKGAYKEPAEVSIVGRSEIDGAYQAHLETLFAKAHDFAVATHDLRMIRRALELAEEHATPFDFEMLQGVRDPLHAELVGQGHRVAEYISYGPKWFPYFGRHMRDRPRHLLMTARAFVSR